MRAVPKYDGWVHFEPAPDLTANELLFALERGFGKHGGVRVLPCVSRADAMGEIIEAGAERHFRVERFEDGKYPLTTRWERRVGW